MVVEKLNFAQGNNSGNTVNYKQIEATQSMAAFMSPVINTTHWVQVREANGGVFENACPLEY